MAPRETRKKTPEALKAGRQARKMTVSDASSAQLSALKAGAQAAETLARIEKKKAERLADENQQVCDLVARYSDKLYETASVGGRVQQDVIAGLGSVGLTELLNYFMRWFAEMSKESAGDKGFWYKNVAYTQTLPGMLGLAYYIVDNLLLHSKEELTERARKNNKAIMPFVPGPWRLTFNKLAGNLSTVGLATFARAIRYSLAESIDERAEKDAVLADQKSALDAANEREKLQRERADRSEKALEDAKKEIARIAAGVRG